MTTASAKPVIGLVGGIGSGKSRVAQLLAQRGGKVLSADPIAHEALRDPEIRARIVRRFGCEILGPDGEIVRARLAGPVFADETARRELESWVFPWVGDRCRELMAVANQDPAIRFVVLDAPVLLEAGWKNLCDRIIYIHTPRNVRLARLAERGWTAEQVLVRERAQWPLAEKARLADAAVDNSGTLEATARQVDDWLRCWNLR